MVLCRRMSLLLILLIGLCGFTTVNAQERDPDVLFVPTPEQVVMEMLKMARVTPQDTVYDLGCGDGRTVIMAAKVFGAKGVGIDIDPIRIKESTQNAIKAGVGDRVRFIQRDIYKSNVSEASVVFLYLLPELNVKLRPQLLKELKPGSRIVSHEFDMEEWRPDSRGAIYTKIFYQPQRSDMKELRFYLWIVPADVAGIWHITIPVSTGAQKHTLHMNQKFQEIAIDAESDGKKIGAKEGQLVGDKLSFTLNEDKKGEKIVMQFNGQIRGNSIEGTVQIQGGPSAGTYAWSASRVNSAAPASTN